MKKLLLLLFGLSLVVLGGCSLTKEISSLHVSEKHETTTVTVSTGFILNVAAEHATTQYIVIHTPNGVSNGENISVYLSGKLIFSKLSGDNEGIFFQLVGNIIFIDYGTSAGNRTMKLFDLSNKGKLIFETEYSYGNGSVKIYPSIDTMYFDYWIHPDPKGVVCSNYDELKKLGGIQYMQKRSYNFKTHELKNLGDIFCAYAE